MTEAEAIESLTNIGSLAATYAGMWLSVTFAYLTVAYLVGAKLSRFQVSAISTLYVLLTSISGATTLGYVDSWTKLREREATIFDSVKLFSSAEVYLPATTAFLIFSTCLALYFMYDVRKNSSA